MQQSEQCPLLESPSPLNDNERRWYCLNEMLTFPLLVLLLLVATLLGFLVVPGPSVAFALI